MLGDRVAADDALVQGALLEGCHNILDEPRVTLAGEGGYLFNNEAETPLNRLQLAAFSRRYQFDILRQLRCEARTFLAAVTSVPQKFFAINEIIAGARDGFRRAREPLAYLPQASDGLVHRHAYHAGSRRIQFVLWDR